MDLNQIDVVGLQQLQTLLDGAERAVAISWIEFGRQKNFFAAFFRELTEPFNPISIGDAIPFEFLRTVVGRRRDLANR
jgi:hypothetical protein